VVHVLGARLDGLLLQALQHLAAGIVWFHPSPIECPAAIGPLIRACILATVPTVARPVGGRMSERNVIIRRIDRRCRNRGSPRQIVRDLVLVFVPFLLVDPEIDAHGLVGAVVGQQLASRVVKPG